jgi:hypothetical protein
MASCGYCETDITPHEVNQCGEEIPSGISALGYIFCDTFTDYSDPSEWDTAIAAGDAVIVKEIVGQYPAASPFSGKNRIGCGPATVNKGADHTVTYEDYNVNSTNDIFYGQVNSRKFKLAVFYCEDQTIRVTDSDDARAFSANPVAAEDNKESQFYPVSVNWSVRANSIGSTLYTAPAGIFE